MACVEKCGEYHRVSSPVPVHPLRPSEPEEATTPLPPSTPQQPKRGILRTSSTDSRSVSSPKKSHFNTVEDTHRDSKDSVQKQVPFPTEVQTVCQTTNAGDVRMDNSTDNGGTDEDGESELNITAAG